MRRFVRYLLVTGLLLAGASSLTGCVVLSPRGRVWVPGFWTPAHVWVGGHWHYRR
ncbi:MAG TPA: hypothetical protein VN043_00160 [Rhodanobacter sp.]|nr:hypothetical protein [Rhodanobacter sp.]